ncbi:hypothetical protein METHPM2_40093 [Pseudomonas sp. PM2]
MQGGWCIAGGCGTGGNKNVERVEGFEPRDVRRIQVGHYEMRYVIVDSTIYLLRLWQTRADR